MLSKGSIDLYYASAGSGKTYALVREYLAAALLLDPSGNGFEQMLAMTFTNKATAEMKVRVLKVLRELSEPDSRSPMFEELLEATQLDASELKRRSGLMHRKILHRYGLFRISTLDSFAQRIIRQFSRDLGLSYGFEIEMDEDLLIEDAVDLLFERVGSDQKMTESLVDFSESRFDREVGWNPRGELVESALHLLNEEFLDRNPLFLGWDFVRFKNLRSHLMRLIVDRNRSIAEKARRALEAIAAQGLVREDFSRGSAWKYFFDASEGRANRASDSLLKQYDSGALYTRACPKATIAKHEAVFELLSGLFGEIETELEDPDDFYLLAQIIARQSHAFALLNAVAELSKLEADRRNLVPIGRFNQMIDRELTEQPSAYLFERIGERSHALLIDEFQDTSVLQWKNLKPLIENTLSEGGSGLIVGDGKQAIYRFRNGRVEQFLELREKARSGSDPQWTYRSLTTNWRSLPAVVDFNNRFFASMSALLSDESHAGLYAESAQIAAAKEGGYVEIHFPGSSKADIWRQELTMLVCERVSELISEGYRPCDIAILVRKNSDARRMAQALRAMDEPIASASDDASALSESLDCRLALALAELYVHPERSEARKTILEFLGSRDLMPSTSDRLEFEKAYAKAKNGWTALCSWFPELGELDRGLPADDFLEHCSRVFALGSSGGAFFSTLIDRSRHLPGNRRDLDALIDWWQDRSDRIRVPLPEREDAVVISTIHKSKGLEYPVVIFAFADEKIDTSNRNVWVNLSDPRFMGLPGFWIPARSTLANEASTEGVRKPIEEKMAQERLDQMNLMYVAMTRAVERLYVYSRGGSKQSNQTRSFFRHFIETEGADSPLYKSGEPSAPLSVHQTKEPPVQLPSFSVAWRKKLRLGRIHIENAEQETGKSVHEILAGLHRLSDWEELRPSDYPEPLSQHLEKAKQAVLEGDYRFFFECETAWNEREWLDSEGIIRPDRLVLDPEGVFHILDYKTGREKPEHLEQIQIYRQRIEQSGQVVGRAALLYL